MQTINLKYKLKDTVIYKASSISVATKSGEIENFFVSCGNTGELEICYYIRNSVTKSIEVVKEKNISHIANNVTNKEVMKGYIAEAYAQEVLKDSDIAIHVVKIEFDGNKTAVTYKANNSDVLKKEISECHIDDKFEKAKGVKLCLSRILIKLLQSEINQI